MLANRRRSTPKAVDRLPEEPGGLKTTLPLQQKFGAGKEGFDTRVFQLRCNLHDRPLKRFQRHVAFIRAQGDAPGQPHSEASKRLPQFDPVRLWCALAREGVDFVVAGGWAGILHGARFTTEDVEVLVAPDEGNRFRLAAVLQALSAPRDAASNGTQSQRLAASAGLVVTPWARLRWGMIIPGTRTYGDLRTRAVTVGLRACRIAILSLDDLIALQQKRTGPFDRALLDDLQLLRELALERTVRSPAARG